MTEPLSFFLSREKYKEYYERMGEIQYQLYWEKSRGYNLCGIEKSHVLSLFLKGD
jgi:hypothetical protein|nr:MAG TPA: hypothetical protein [Caudoviricetes sp.]